MKRTAAILACAAITAFASAPQSPDNKTAGTTKAVTATQNDQHLKTAYKLLETMDMKNTYGKMLERITDNLIDKIPTLKNSREKILDFYRKYIGWDAIKDDQAKIYKKYFSIEEMKDLMSFYATPTGKKTLRILPEIMSEGQALAQKNMSAHMDELKKIIAESLQEYKKSVSGTDAAGKGSAK